VEAVGQVAFDLESSGVGGVGALSGTSWPAQPGVMGVHDNADSKYSLMGSGSSFSKFAVKRSNVVVLNDSPSKLPKHEELQPTVQRDQGGAQHAEFTDKISISLQQQRKQLPVYKLSKRCESCGLPLPPSLPRPPNHPSPKDPPIPGDPQRLVARRSTLEGRLTC
jgi:hypothetical protein